MMTMMVAAGAGASASTRGGNEGERELKEGWTLIPSTAVSEMGALHARNWQAGEAIPVTLPITVFAALVDGDRVEDPFWAKRLQEFDTTPYASPWIYRTVFDLDPTLPTDFVELVFEGINYRGNVWLNGEPIAEAKEFEGPYKMYRLDVTRFAKPEGNVLVVEVFPPAKDDLTIGWVDWNPYPPDNNLGLWRPVKVRQTGPVSLRAPFVITDLDLDTFASADLHVSGVLENHSDQPQSGTLKLTYEAGAFELPFELAPRESRELALDPQSAPVLRVEDPQVWWPHDLGEQPLYHMHFEVQVADLVSEAQNVRFGIREVSDYLNEQGHRGWKVNGKEVLIRGGGWVDDLFLREDPQRLKDQIAYVRHMHLNTVRLEGFWGSSQQLFDLCDEAGILLMIGWSCHWEWEGYCNRPTDNYLLIRPEEEAFQAQSFADQVVWVRNHPSVLMWVFGSDMIPRPSLEKALTVALDEVDPTRPRLLGCRNEAFGGEQFFGSETYGPVAVKMIGPYHYVTPNYWYEDTTLGGAFGFNTETGPGLQPAVLESVKRFTPADQLWPLNEVWDFHTGRGDVFGTFKDWIKPFEARYGASDSVEDFCAWAQVSNYEAIRPMFEAFAAHKPVATGVIQWMLNSAFPNHLWQLYDYYLMPTGAFYGTRKACQPLNAIYDYGARNILVTNDTLTEQSGLTLEAKLFDRESQLIWSDTMSDLELSERSVQQAIVLPELPTEKAAVYFLDLRLRDAHGAEITNNFYWISNMHEDLAYEKSTWYHTPNSTYADLSLLRSLPEAEVNASFQKTGMVEDRQTAEVKLHNPSAHLAFFIELSVKDAATGTTLLPVFWEDNYVSLLPGETRTLRVEYPATAPDQDVVFSCKGLNTPNPN